MFNFGPHLLIIFGLRHETAFVVEVKHVGSLVSKRLVIHITLL